MAGEHILIVDDEKAIQKALRGVLEDEGYRVSAVGSGSEALKAITDELPDVIFLDIWMPHMDGLETLAELKRLRPEATVVMISGHGTIETAVKATRLGAYDFIEKPLSLEKTLVTVTRALEHTRLERENANLKARLDLGSEISGYTELERRGLATMRFGYSHGWLMDNPNYRAFVWRLGDTVGHGSDMLWNIGVSITSVGESMCSQRSPACTFDDSSPAALSVPMQLCTDPANCGKLSM